jgi:hypothetical protein
MRLGIKLSKFKKKPHCWANLDLVIKLLIRSLLDLPLVVYEPMVFAHNI